MISQLPDAPYIRDAELNGMPEDVTFNCPICNAENPDTFYLVDGEIVGCDQCMESSDAWKWYYNNVLRQSDMP